MREKDKSSGDGGKITQVNRTKFRDMRKKCENVSASDLEMMEEKSTKIISLLTFFVSFFSCFLFSFC